MKFSTTRGRPWFPATVLAVVLTAQPILSRQDAQVCGTHDLRHREELALHHASMRRRTFERRAPRIEGARQASRDIGNIAVIDDAAHTPLLRGDLLYRFCALRQLFSFPGSDVEVEPAGGPSVRVKALMVTISNANYFGGSFHIAPRASLSDGLLDAVVIQDASPLRRAADVSPATVSTVSM